jgi:O-antigen/teichoic acid export membrane protein
MADQLGNLFFRGLRYNLLLVFPTFFILALFAERFFLIWAGPEFAENSSVPFYVILVGLLFNIPAYLPYSLIMAKGRSDIFAKLYGLEVVPYLLLAIALTERWGIYGAAAAWSIRIIIDAVLLFWIARNISFFSLPFRELSIRLLPGLILIVGLFIGSRLDDRWWISFAVAGFSLVAYCGLALKVAFDKDESAFIHNRILRAVESMRLRLQ